MTRTVALPDGTLVPALGMGTWGMGEDPARRTEELAAVRLGLDLGMTLIDTAEMYGEGATERFLGEALAGRRDEVFLVPEPAAAGNAIARTPTIKPATEPRPHSSP